MRLAILTALILGKISGDSGDAVANSTREEYDFIEALERLIDHKDWERNRDHWSD
jgi:hypothetical protein